ncbi:MAG: hypothetical protein KQJ78_07810 [Deltaproteobacteria bacterium]|nr:hypothetical protein [Deltaproteobacteria bacterium]MCB2186307.1 hypothetical protein [Deltaproteobacteria bacterium]
MVLLYLWSGLSGMDHLIWCVDGGGYSHVESTAHHGANPAVLASTNQSVIRESPELSLHHDSHSTDDFTHIPIQFLQLCCSRESKAAMQPMALNTGQRAPDAPAAGYRGPANYLGYKTIEFPPLLGLSTTILLI